MFVAKVEVCSSCLESFIKKKANICPECKQNFQMHSSTDLFVKDYRKNSLVTVLNSAQFKKKIDDIPMCHECGKVQAAFHCESCQTSLCEEDDIIIHKPKVLQTHQRVRIEQLKDEVASDEVIVEKKRQVVAKWKNITRVVHQTLQSKKIESNEKKTQLTSHFATMNQLLDKTFSQYRKMIDSLEEKLKSDVEVSSLQATGSLAEYQQKLDAELLSIKLEQDIIEAAPISQWPDLLPKIEASVAA